MIFVTYYFAYWRHNLDPMIDTKHVMIPIYRIRGVPTQQMIDNNISRWAEGWNLTSSEPNSGLFLVENGMPVRKKCNACVRDGSARTLALTHLTLVADQFCHAHRLLLCHLGRLPLLRAHRRRV